MRLYAPQLQVQHFPKEIRVTSIARAGTLLSVESGCYSDYGVVGFFVVLKDFDPRAELDEYLSTRPDQNQQYSFENDQFLAVILAKGLLLEIKYGVLHLSDYSRIEEFRFAPVDGDAK